MASPASDTVVPPVSCSGKLHLLDSASIKERLGSKWSRVSGIAESFFENAISRNLGEGDTFVHHGELTYFILFRNLTQQEAQLKCRAICEEVCLKLFGEQLSHASLRVLTAPGTQAPGITGAYDALDTFLETTGKETIITMALPENVKPPAMEKKAPQHDPQNDVTFIYRPVWDAVKRVVVTYLCEAVTRNDGEHSGLDPSSPQYAQSRMALDKLALRQCADHTQQLHRDNLRILTAAPICFTTLTHSRLWMAYSEELRKIPADISRDLAFMISGIDPGVPNVRLSQEMPKLSRSVRSIFCLVNDSGNVGARFARTGTHAIGLSVGATESEISCIERMKRLAQQSSEAGLEAFVLGVSSTSILLSALSCGVRYVEGSAIRPSLSNPRHAFAQSLEYVYSAKSAKSQPA